MKSNEFSESGFQSNDELIQANTTQLQAAATVKCFQQEHQTEIQTTYGNQHNLPSVIGPESRLSSQMIAHKQHLVQPSSQAPGGQQQVPMGHTRHLGEQPQQQQQQQYYVPNSGSQQQQQRQQQQYSNTSADTNHHQVYHTQQQIISSNNVEQQHPSSGNNSMRFQQRQVHHSTMAADQAAGMIDAHNATGRLSHHHQQQSQYQTHQHHPQSAPQQQQQYHSNVIDQSQPQVPPPNQLPYHHQLAPNSQPAYEQQQQQHSQVTSMQSNNHQPNYVAIEQQQQQPDVQQHHPPQMMHHSQQRQLQQQQPKNVGPMPMRPGGQLQQRVSPYPNANSNQQLQSVRPAPAARMATGGQQPQYKPVPRDFQQQQHHNHHHIPAPPQAQQLVLPNNNSQPTSNYQNGNANNGAYLMNGTNPQFMEGEQYQTGSPTTLLQQQLNRQVPPSGQQQQRPGGPVQQSAAGPHHHPMHLHAHPQQAPPPPAPQHLQQRGAPPGAGYVPSGPAGSSKGRVVGTTARYVDEQPDMMESYEVIHQQQQQQPPPPSSRVHSQQVVGPNNIGLRPVGATHAIGDPSYQQAHTGRAAAPGQLQHQTRMGFSNGTHTRAPQINQRMMMMENSHHHHLPQQQQQQQHGPPPHLLGNPTPPLTPNSNPSHLAVSGGVGRNPAAAISHQVVADGVNHSWQPTQPHHHHGPAPMGGDHVQQPAPPPANRYNVGSSSLNSLNNKQHNNNNNNNNLVEVLPMNDHQLQQQQRITPKNSVGNNFQQKQQHPYHPAPQQPITSHIPPVPPTGPSQPTQQLPQYSQSHNHHHHQNPNHQAPAGQATGEMGPAMIRSCGNQVATAAPVVSSPDHLAPSQARLTLPLRDAPLLGPFRLQHDEQFISRVFHIKPQLFETLTKSMSLVNPQVATVVQELQFRAYIVKQTNGASSHGDSLLASNNQHHNHQHHHHQQQQHHQTKPCSWPEHFQVSINGNVVQLDRSKAAHRAADIFQFCRMGDNVLEMQVNDCYCSHEFVLEAVDRPTLKAFMSSCFKSRRLAPEACIQKLKFNFGAPGFLVQHNNATGGGGVFNEYVSEFSAQVGLEQTKARVSLRCPISGRRMRTPTRGYHCKHLQCFDLEVFLFTNRERSRWSCPLCSLAIPFNMLELDQHQMDIIHAMPAPPPMDADDILVDESGQWQAYHHVLQAQQQQPTTIMPQTAKSTGTYHPQAPPLMNGLGSPAPPSGQHHQPMRPQSGPIIPTTVNRMQPAATNGSWDSIGGATVSSPHIDCHSPAGGPVRRPASAISQAATGRRSANGSPLAKKAYSGQYAQQAPQQTQLPPAAQQAVQPAPAQAAFFTGESQQQANITPFGGNAGGSRYQDDSDDLSPLAAMERTIIQHEQQMGPPPFDPNSLTSSPAPLRSSSASSLAPNASVTGPNNSSSLISPSPQPPQTSSAIVQTSPAHNQAAASFSPVHHGIANSPAGARMVPASPQQRMGAAAAAAIVDLPQSPMQQQITTVHQGTTSISTPATPSSSMMIHGGPETPATPGNTASGLVQQHCGSAGPASVSAVSHSSPHVATNTLVQQQQQSSGVVDHQPLSNGSVSAGSITSTSTMTPSGQSLGSVGIGGDNRCGTAPLQGTPGPLGLDDLMLPGGSSQQTGNGVTHQFKSQSSMCEEKNEIMMGKLMMDSSESLLHRNGELDMALEEAEWKEQLDRGKSEHLANFLNEPLMKKQQQHHYQQQQAQQQGSAGSKMLSGGLHPSDDEGNQSHNSSPGHNIDQLDGFANYLDADIADTGAGLPPDDSILDLFER